MHSMWCEHPMEWQAEDRANIDSGDSVCSLIDECDRGMVTILLFDGRS